MELRRLKAPFEFGVRSAIDAFDCDNQQVNGFLRHYAEPIVDQGLGTVLVLVEDGEILSFVSLSFASMTLTNSEKGAFRSVTTAFGAVRIGSIGTATRHQGRSCGSTLLQATVGRARRISEIVGVRYLMADANDDRVSWYQGRGWVTNGALKERDRLAGRKLTSMRFDLRRSVA
jgi:GNAT superfamily N-acetyltransferase